MVALRANHANFYFSSHHSATSQPLNHHQETPLSFPEKPWQPNKPNQAHLTRPNRINQPIKTNLYPFLISFNFETKRQEDSPLPLISSFVVISTSPLLQPLLRLPLCTPEKGASLASGRVVVLCITVSVAWEPCSLSFRADAIGRLNKRVALPGEEFAITRLASVCFAK